MVYTSDMKQAFKSIYFSDHPALPSAQRHISLAFGANDHLLYERIRRLSSEELRQLLVMDSYDELVAYARSNALSINRACISILHRTLDSQPAESLSTEIPALVSDPLIATYRRWNGGPLHSWFPLLEGFSPRFVRAVLQIYAPKAKIVLDPFAGTGAAPLTAAAMGFFGLYCELNPVLQFVSETKYKALQLMSKARKELAERLGELAFNLGFQLGNLRTDEFLRDTYSRAFNGSQFFSPDTFDDVLRLRTLADELSARVPLLGQMFTVAVLASLVPASFMMRRGDLRYKRPEELGPNRICIRSEVSRRLEQMALEVEQLDQVPGQAILVAEDTKSLSRLPHLGVECVITSPPYLNGTNYFRNTKLELWFLRVLTKPEDLAAWRYKSLTSGINDVTQAKCDKPCSEVVKDVVESIRKSAYDSRIPLMVASYFRELEQVFLALSSHLIPGAILAIDIGDSRYGGIRVETDNLLARIAANHGFQVVATHTLRIRKSRDGGLLRETLLVFEYSGHSHKAAVAPRTLEGTSAKCWNEFKAGLPHQSLPFNKRNWGHPLHSLCSYEGKMKPSVAHFLVRSFVPEDGKVLDPFAGVGTIPFEACLQGKKAFGFEISPAALVIATAKVSRPQTAEVRRVLESLRDYLQTEEVTEQEIEFAKKMNFNRSLDEFYHEGTLREILLARRFFSRLASYSIETSLVLACLLHILHGNRPYALSRHSHPVTPFAPRGPREYRSLIERLAIKLDRSLNVEYPSQFREGRIYMQDATDWWPREVDDLDAVVTSPPFFDSTRFYLANWIRLWFCGWERRDFETQPLRFLDLKQKQSMRSYEPVFRQARERLKPDGLLVLHLGRSVKCNMAEKLSQIAKPWFRTIDVFEENVSHCEFHGIRDKGRVSAHQYLILG